MIDCVGMDGTPLSKEKAEQKPNQFGTISPILTASEAVKKFGTVQLTGAYISEADGFPLGVFTRNVSLKMGQAPVIHLMPMLYQMIEQNEIDPTDIITHKMSLAEAPAAYDIFDKKKMATLK